MTQTAAELEAIGRKNLLGACEDDAMDFNRFMAQGKTNLAKHRAEKVAARNDAEGTALFESLIKYEIPAEPFVMPQTPIRNGIWETREGATEMYRNGRLVSQVWDEA